MRPGDPTQIGAYRIEGELGRGTFGAVFRVRHTANDAVRALKLLSGGADPIERKRFRREAELQARLDRHPNVLRVHEAGEWRGRDYLVLDYAAGGTLRQRMKRGVLAPEQAIQIAIQIASALEHMHAHGVLHRDIKPANVLFTEDDRPLLADFGLARGSSTSSLTASGMVLGSPMYMSPEQASGENRNLGPAADLYALGGVLYALIAGRPPFAEASSVLALLDEVLNTPPPPLESVVPDVDPRLARVVSQCLEKDPAQRPASAAEVALALRRVLEPEAEPAAGPSPVLIAGALSALLLASLLGVGAWVLYRPSPTEEASAPPSGEQAAVDGEQPPSAGEAPAKALLQPLLAHLAADEVRQASAAWEAIAEQVAQLERDELEALEAAALAAGSRAFVEPSEEGFPAFAALCCRVVAASGSALRGRASPEFGDAVMHEAIERARSARDGERGERDALDWIVSACAALEESELPVTDALALPLLDVIWDATGVRFSGHDERRVQVMVSLVQLGVLPSQNHVISVPLRDALASEPARYFLAGLRRVSAPPVSSGGQESEERMAELALEFSEDLSILLDDPERGGALNPWMRNVLEFWRCQGLRRVERLEGYTKLANQIGPAQPRLGFGVALALMLRDPTKHTELAPAPGVALALVKRIDPKWIERACSMGDSMTMSCTETLCAALYTFLANDELESFRELYAVCPRTVRAFVNETCPPWLKPRYDGATE